MWYISYLLLWIQYGFTRFEKSMHSVFIYVLNIYGFEMGFMSWIKSYENVPFLVTCQAVFSYQSWNWAAMLGAKSAAAVWGEVKWPSLASGLLLNKAVKRGQSALCERGSFLPHGDNGPHILYATLKDETGKSSTGKNLDKHPHSASIAFPGQMLNLWMWVIWWLPHSLWIFD